MTLYHCWFDDVDETEDKDQHIISHAHTANPEPDDATAATGNAGGATGNGGKGGKGGKGIKGGKGGGKPGGIPKQKAAPKAKTPQQLARTVSRWSLFSFAAGRLLGLFVGWLVLG